MCLDGVNGVRLGTWSLCHHARPREVELLHKVQAGVQAQCRVLHNTDLVSDVHGLIIRPAVPASPDPEMSRHKKPNGLTIILEIWVWPLSILKHMHKGPFAKCNTECIQSSMMRHTTSLTKEV